MGAAESASAYAEGFSENILTTRRAGKRRGSAGARGAGQAVFFAGRRACRRNRGAESRAGGFVGARGAENGTEAELCARHAERAGASAGRCITSVDVLRLIKREGSALA